MKDVQVSTLLTEWSGDELHVYVLGDRWDYSVLTVIVRERALMFVSDSASAPTHAPPPAPSKPTDIAETSIHLPQKSAFGEWFRDLVEAPLPIQLSLIQLGPDLWGSLKTRGRTRYGRSWLPRIYGLRDYTLFGFGGYGSSSYAVFMTRRRGDTELMLRLWWGGAYPDPESQRPRLLSELAEANHLFERAAHKRLPMHFCIDMDACRFDTSPAPDGAPLGSLSIPDGSFKALRAYVGEPEPAEEEDEAIKPDAQASNEEPR